MRKIHWGLTALLAMFVAFSASAENAFAVATGDVVSYAYRGNIAPSSVSWGNMDCRAMSFLPRSAPEEDDRLLCSSQALGVNAGIPGAHGFSTVLLSGGDWTKFGKVSSDEYASPAELCTFTNPDDMLSGRMSYLGNQDLGSLDSASGNYYHDFSVGVNSLSGNDEQWIIWYDAFIGGAFVPKGCKKLSYSTGGLMDGFRGKLVEVGANKFCTGNVANSQILCFELVGLTVNPSSEVLIDSTDMTAEGAPAFLGGLQLTFSDGKLFVADVANVYAITLNGDLTVNDVVSSPIDANCAGGTTALEKGPDLDENGSFDLFLGNGNANGAIGALCELFVDASGAVLNTVFLTDDDQHGIPFNGLLIPDPVIRHGDAIVPFSDNGDGTHTVMVAVSNANSDLVSPPADGGFMEYVIADASIATEDTGCPPTPATICVEGLQGSLKITDSATAGKDSWKWSMKRGETFDQASLGDPVASTNYTVCVYDNDGIVRFAGGNEIGFGALWTSKTPKGFLYKDKLGNQDGITQVKMKTSAEAGKSSVQVACKGTNCVPPTFFGFGKYFSGDPNVTIQLHNSIGNCWSSTFSGPYKKNEPASFQADFKP